MHSDQTKIHDKICSLPSSLLFKMQSRWNRIHRALDQLRKESINLFGVKQFEDISRYAGVSWTGFERLKVNNVFSIANEGLIEIKPFQLALQALLQSCCYPPADIVATSLAMGPHFDSRRAEGKSIEIKALRATWNNLHRQMPGPAGSGEPLVKSILEGRFYEQRQEPVRPQTWHRGNQPGLTLDPAMHQVRSTCKIKCVSTLVGRGLRVCMRLSAFFSLELSPRRANGFKSGAPNSSFAALALRTLRTARLRAGGRACRTRSPRSGAAANPVQRP